MKNPVLFLTGSSGALAASVRDLFLREGWSVAGFDRKPNDFQHPAFRFYSVDAMDEPSVEKAFTNAVEAMGPPRTLVATVGGIRQWKPVAESSVEDFRFLFELNLLSFFISAKQSLRLMKTGGTIISIGAESALVPSANKAGYSAAKAGVLALSRVIAEEGSANGISSNVIVPNVIRTTANEEWGSPEEIPKWTKPEDIAAMCLFLSSEAGRAVNGAVIRMPNGL